MNKKEEIEESLEFCKDIKLYTHTNNIKSMDRDKNYSMQSSALKEYVDWLDIIEHSLSSAPTNRSESSINCNALQTVEDNATVNISKKLNAKSLLREAYSLAICIAIAFVIAYFVTTFIGQHTKVEGSSMESALSNNDYLIIDKLSYHLSDPVRFDIIIFPFDENIYYVKRIIGMPGERVLIQDGEIYINDVLLRESYGTEEMIDAGAAASELTLAKDEYFVLGDNRNDSKDSRRAEVGLIKRKDIIGKAFFRFFPFDKMGDLKN